MASTGFTLPGDSGQIADGGTEPWQNQNAVETEANYADSESLDAGDETQLIYCYDYGFSIPAGATITGIEVRVTRYRRKDSVAPLERTTKTKKVILMDGASTLGSDNKDTDTADWAQGPATETITYGGSSDLWGASGTIDRAFVQSSDFGAGISAKGVSPCTNSNAYLKFIKINVHYTAPEPEFRAQVIV